MSQTNRLGFLAIALTVIGAIGLAIFGAAGQSTVLQSVVVCFSAALIPAAILVAVMATTFRVVGGKGEIVDDIRAAIKREGDQIRVQIGLASDFDTLGLSEVRTDATKIDYDDLILRSKRLSLLLNDGRTFLSTHRDRLRKRFADPLKETVVFLSHPDSEMITVLARKGSTDVETIKSRIRESVALLVELKQPQTQLEVLGHLLFNPHSLVVGDSALILTPYFVSRGGRTVPAFRYSDVGEDSYFQQIVSDLDSLRIDTKDILELGHGQKGNGERSSAVIQMRSRAS